LSARGFAPIDPAALGTRAEAMVAELAAISAEPGRLVRLFLTPEHRRAADLVAGWMRAAGLSVGEDALGTVRGRFGGAARRLLIGSHIDTVVDAGKYDGTLGVIAGILAAEHFARAKANLPFGLDVLAFGDEEGSRFPATLTSSSACAGVFERDALASTDRAGVTLEQALRSYGKDPSGISAAAYSRSEAAGYVEVHIEQGPALEANSAALGVVTGIVGQARLRVTVTGEAGHAGTMPMTLRRDAYAGAAEMALALENITRQHPQDGMADRIARTRGLKIAIESFHEIETAHCAPALQEALASSIAELGHTPIRLPSGAGHDAQVMARLCPSAMLFVRCRGGISHNPAEFASVSDMGVAIAALIRFIEKFQPDGAPG
jgi:allantoate deiminase